MQDFNVEHYLDVKNLVYNITSRKGKFKPRRFKELTNKNAEDMNYGRNYRIASCLEISSVSLVCALAVIYVLCQSVLASIALIVFFIIMLAITHWREHLDKNIPISIKKMKYDELCDYLKKEGYCKIVLLSMIRELRSRISNLESKKPWLLPMLGVLGLPIWGSFINSIMLCSDEPMEAEEFIARLIIVTIIGVIILLLIRFSTHFFGKTKFWVEYKILKLEETIAMLEAFIYLNNERNEL